MMKVNARSIFFLVRTGILSKVKMVMGTRHTKANYANGTNHTVVLDPAKGVSAWRTLVNVCTNRSRKRRKRNRELTQQEEQQVLEQEEKKEETHRQEEEKEETQSQAQNKEPLD